MSLGGGGNGIGGSCPSTGNALRDAVCRATAAGITVVSAAGNEGSNLVGSQPGAFPESLTVTAMADRDGRPGKPCIVECVLAWLWSQPAVPCLNDWAQPAWKAC